jgi:hypothetical protein
MMTRVDGILRRVGRPARSVVIGASFVAVMFAGGVATGVMGDGSDGRDGGSQPSAPGDAPTPVPVDSDAGRGGSDNDTAPAVAAPDNQIASDAQVAIAVLPKANGRGGLDPSSGPLPVAQIESSVEAIQSLDAGSFDTDSGLAPEPSAKDKGKGKGPTDSSRQAEAAPSAPVDQDVPGAPTGGPPGDDLPSNDADG